MLSWSEDHTLRLWDGQTGLSLAVLEGHTRSIRAVHVLTAGRVLSWSSDNGLGKIIVAVQRPVGSGSLHGPPCFLEESTEWVTAPCTRQNFVGFSSSDGSTSRASANRTSARSVTHRT